MEWLGDLLDLPPTYGGGCLHQLKKAADEEFLGSYAGITSSLIAFCRRTEQHAYIQIAEALEDMDPPREINEPTGPLRTPCPQ
jgi:hypothetical protein